LVCIGNCCRIAASRYLATCCETQGFRLFHSEDPQSTGFLLCVNEEIRYTPHPKTMLATTMRRAAQQGRRLMSDGLTAEGKIKSLPMVYIKGEEMTRYAAQLMLENWLEPHVDTSAWEFFDLSCAARDASNDQTLKDAVAAGAKIGAIFKEPTVTPSAEQVKEFGLSKPLPSPNGAMRRGWNGVTISRDTIHIDGVELGFKSPVLFERHAVGGEYGAGWKEVGKGRLVTTYFPDKEAFEDGAEAIIVDARILDNERNVAVVYHNPLDNVEALAHHFFSRTLKAGVTPYVVTKKTVFKWQEPFWSIHKKVFDENYKAKFLEQGLLDNTGGELQHLISDAATMQIIRWTRGGFGMSAHNYDGDMLTDEVAQVHRSPGFITSNLVGVVADGSPVKFRVLSFIHSVDSVHTPRRSRSSRPRTARFLICGTSTCGASRPPLIH
jgi:isocitrate dehydrogenase